MKDDIREDSGESSFCSSSSSVEIMGFDDRLTSGLRCGELELETSLFGLPFDCEEGRGDNEAGDGVADVDDDAGAASGDS